MNAMLASASEVSAAAALAVLSAAVCVCFVRLAIGPSLPDRVVALDMIGTLLVGMFVLAGIVDANPDAVRVATVLALINFLATVAFATYVRRKAGR
jgi:multicomponent Na+:H+ antiporter subunit F